MKLTGRQVVSIVLVIAVLAAFAAAFHFLVPQYIAAQNKAIGANVTVTGTQVPRAMRATTVALTPPFNSQLQVSKSVDISPSGPLPAPITLRFKLNAQVQQGDIVLLATSESANGPWSLMTPTLSSDGWYATVQTTHLSLFSVTNVDPSKLLDALKSFFNGVTANLFTNATPPRCDHDYYHDPTLAHEGYSASWIGGAFYHQTTESSIYWCFGIENGRPAVKIVNKLSYPLDVSHSGFTMYSGNGLQFSLDQIARFAAGPDTILYPYQEADFYVTAPAGSKPEISTDASPLASALGAFQTTVLAGFFLIAELAPTIETSTQVGVEFTINGQDVWVFLSKTTLTLGDEDDLLKVLNIVLGDIPACVTAIYQFRDHPDPGGLVGSCLPALFDAIKLVAVATAAVLVAATVISGVLGAALIVLGVISIISGIKSLVAVLHDATTNLMQYHVTVTNPKPTSTPPNQPPPPPPPPTVTVAPPPPVVTVTVAPPPPPAKSIQIGWSSAHPTWIWMTLNGFPVGSYPYTCSFSTGGDATFTLQETTSPETWDNGKTCYDTVAGDVVWVQIGSVSSNKITVSAPPPPSTYSETAGPAGSGTFTYYTNAGAPLGQRVAAYQTIQVSCRLTGWTAPDGDNWWYRIATGPWNNGFYAPADNFYNNGQTSGSLTGTPFVDTKVPLC